MSKLIIIISFFSVYFMSSQSLEGVDIIVSNYHNIKNIDELSNKIKTDFYSEQERVRAIYTWIANNIRYDNNYLIPPEFTIYTTQKQYDEQSKIRIKSLAINTFNSKKGICNNYASLFYQLCINLDIKCEIVVGYAKNKVTTTTSNTISSLSSNHAWNKVLIDNEYYLIDTAWSRNIIPNKNGYIKLINYDYFLTNPYLFILDHYPKHFKDSLINDYLPVVSFINYPRIFIKGYKEIRLIRPTKSSINKTKKSNTKFIFQISKPVENVSYFLGNQFHNNISYNYNNNFLIFNLDLKDSKDNNLTLYINNEAICSYLLK